MVAWRTHTARGRDLGGLDDPVSKAGQTFTTLLQDLGFHRKEGTELQQQNACKFLVAGEYAQQFQPYTLTLDCGSEARSNKVQCPDWGFTTYHILKDGDALFPGFLYWDHELRSGIEHSSFLLPFSHLLWHFFFLHGEVGVDWVELGDESIDEYIHTYTHTQTERQTERHTHINTRSIYFTPRKRYIKALYRERERAKEKKIVHDESDHCCLSRTHDTT